MRTIGLRGDKVCSTKLLRRLEAKGIIEEPPPDERPSLPSRRAWGGRRGYHYVINRLNCDAFDFEGTSYRFSEEEGLTYLYRIHDNSKDN